MLSHDHSTNRSRICSGDWAICEDLSEAILAAGASKASDNASPDLLAAEEMARAQRVGMWRNGRGQTGSGGFDVRPLLP